MKAREDGTYLALVDDKWVEAMVAGVLVGFGNNVGGQVRGAQVEDFALLDEGVK